MAHIEIRWVCPVCRRCWDNKREARACAASHVRKERWAVSDVYPGKAVACNYRGDAFALREADKPDLINPPMGLELIVGGRRRNDEK